METKKFIFLSGAAGEGKLMTMEEKREGSVAWDVYKYYFLAFGKAAATFILLVYVFETGLRVSLDWYVF